MAQEKWLALDNEDHDKFAEAMTFCQNSSAGCANVGRCAFDGDCFRADVSAYRDAASKIRKLAQDEQSLLRLALLEAAGHMDAMGKVVTGTRADG